MKKVLETYDEVKDALMRGLDISFEICAECKEIKNDFALSVNSYNIGDPYYQDNKLVGIYAGWCQGKHIVVALHDAPEQLNHDDAVKYCEDMGLSLPTKQELMLIYINKEIINKALLEAGGEPLKEDDYYWSSTYDNDGRHYYVNMSSGTVYNYSDYYCNYVRPVLAF